MSERQPGLVSVIVPVHNRASLLREAVGSALGQTYANLEVVIVDDTSTDQTPAVIAGLVACAPGRVRALRQAENRGPGPSRELGRQAARGEFIQYLDSDDLLLPDKLAKQVEGLRIAEGAAVSYGWTRLRLPDGTPVERPFKRSAERLETILPAFLVGRIWNTTTPLYRASICDAAGPWTDLRLEEDWEYDCRIGALGAALHFVDDWVCEYRSHAPNRLSSGRVLDPLRLRQQARAHVLICGHARRAGIGSSTSEMAHFARALFLIARRCGAAGLGREAKELLALARSASTPERARGWGFRVFGGLASVLGWRLAGRFALLVDALRAPR